MAPMGPHHRGRGLERRNHGGLGTGSGGDRGEKKRRGSSGQWNHREGEGRRGLVVSVRAALASLGGREVYGGRSSSSGLRRRLRDEEEASSRAGLPCVHTAIFQSLMALKAETPLLDYIEVSSSVLRFKEKEKADAGAVVPDCTRVKRDGASSNAKGEQLVPSVVPGTGQEEAGSSWRQEYLIAESHGRPVCMVCGSALSSSGPAAARKHILQQHAHSLDFSLEEKHNILEAWSEGAVLPTVEPQPSLEGSPSESKRQAEIEVLLDSEEQPSGRKRGRLKARCELLHLDPERRAQGRLRRHNSDSAKDARSKQSGMVEGKEWLSECGVPGSAPAEIRIFTDGTFPAGFTLKLYCRTQPEPPQDSGVKPDTRKKRTVDRNCSVSLLRLHSTDSPRHLCSSQGATSRPLTSSAGSNAKDCGTRASQRVASAGKEDAALLAKGFNPIWRARFLMDFDAAAGHLVCMVCEYPLRRVCLTTVKRHILQCHAETLNLPREVRRTIREVWESRNQSSPPAPKK